MLMQTFSLDSSSKGALPTSSSYASTPTAQLSTCVAGSGEKQEIKAGQEVTRERVKCLFVEDIVQTALHRVSKQHGGRNCQL